MRKRIKRPFLMPNAAVDRSIGGGSQNREQYICRSEAKTAAKKLRLVPENL